MAVLLTDPAVATPAPGAAVRRAGVAALLLAMAAALVLVVAGLVQHPAARLRAPRPLAGGRTAQAAPLPAVPPPPVQPTVYADLTPDQARASNAAVPFAPGKPAAAAHFTYSGTLADRAAALTCLTAAVLYEAGDDAVGEQAVAQVVLNRLRHPAFPKTVCGVVFQGSDRPTGCQFTFTCDGSLDRPPRPAAWTRAREIADAALSGHVDAAVGTATHYHTDWVVPYWRDTLVKLAAVHTQIFYRWPGAWGEPRAFTGRAQPLERLDPRLVPLAGPEAAGAAPAADGSTTAQASAAPIPAGDADAALPVPPAVEVAGVSASALAGSTVRLADQAAGQFVLQLNPDASAASYHVAALALCRHRADCLVFGWLSPDHMPRRLPVLPRGLSAMTFLFRRNSLLPQDQSYWNCRQRPRDDPAECLPGT